MNWKHLLWIIPIVMILGAVFGFLTGISQVTQLTTMLEEIDECQLDTLNYAMEQNQECRVLISGYFRVSIVSSFGSPSILDSTSEFFRC